jgi:elongation factor G
VNPSPLSIAVRPRTAADPERLARGLARLTVEDSLLSVMTGPITGETIIAGVGEMHLENILERLKREFGVEASVGPPRVAFREALTLPADGEAKYARQRGGRGEYGHVRLRVYPGEPGSGCAFENRIIGGAIPEEFIRPTEEGIQAALTRGVIAGYPVEDVRVELTGGSYHDADSSDDAFRTAAGLAFHDAATRADPVLLEPLMRVEVVVHHEHLDDVITNLLGRRGRIESQHARHGMQVVDARVPLAEMFGYVVDLRERTRGRGTVAMQFDRYVPCPPPAEDDGDRDAFVAAPRRPRPTSGRFGVALPEPDDEPPRA